MHHFILSISQAHREFSAGHCCFVVMKKFPPQKSLPEIQTIQGSLATEVYRNKKLSWCWQTCKTHLQVSQGHLTL